MRRTHFFTTLASAVALSFLLSATLTAQPQPDERDGRAPRQDGPPRDGPGFGPPGFGPPGGGGPREGGPGGGGPGGGPNREEQKLLEEFDANKNGWLESSERTLARRAAKAHAANNAGRGRRGPGGPGGAQESQPQLREPQAGKQVSPADVQTYPDAELYDPQVLRTLFLEFENPDWETELSDFRYTDVEVPATLTVDGQEYPQVGVRFRGQSSYFRVPAGKKRSLNLSLDLVDSKQRLGGYRTLNLLNSNGDSSMMSSVLYSQIANQHIPAPKANFVRVVINGESWGLYVSTQQFNKDFLKQHYDTKKGTRWKVPGNPRADGGLRYLGEDLEPYRERFTIKPSDNDHAWQDLIKLCRTLNETPADELVAALEPMLDIDGALWFLALDVALVNSDGYWTRASDYSIYQGPDGRFHFIPHDMNEAFVAGSHGPPGGRGGGNRGRGRRRGQPQRGGPGEGFGPPGAGPPEGRPGGSGQGFGPPGDRRGGRGPGGGGGGGGRGGGVTLDPLVGLDNDRMPLRSKLLAVPELKGRYLKFVREIATKSLDWQSAGPHVAAYRELLSPDVKADTRKLSTYQEFMRVTDSRRPSGKSANAGSNPGETLRTWFEKRQEYLLKQTANAE